eukprot:tig00020927_g15953.t1
MKPPGGGGRWLRDLFSHAVVLLITCSPYLTGVALWLLWKHSLLAFCALLVWSLFDPAPTRGGRRWPGFQQGRIMQAMSDYFPCSLQLSSPLPPGPKIFGIHPHGVFTFSAFTVLGGPEGSRKLGELYISATSLLFCVPFIRDFALAVGCIHADRETLERTLRAGKSVTITVGGVREGLETRTGRNRLVLSKRNGFVRIACRTGAPLVPVFMFGETDIFRIVAPAGGRFPMTRLLRALHIPVPPFVGRPLPLPFPLSLPTPLPHRRALRTVVGEALDVGPAEESPSGERLAAVHGRYCAALRRLYAAHRQPGDPELELLDADDRARL